MTNDRTPTNTDDSQWNSPSRRTFAGAVAALGTTALAGCSGGDSMEAGTSTATEEPTDEPTDSPTETPTPNPDVDVLNYALTLEHLENAFYREGLKEFSDDELMGADVLSKFGEAVRMDVPKYLGVVSAHEKAHVDAISKTVTKLGGEPVTEADYDFGYGTPSEFLGVAKALENTGVAAYAGAAPQVKSNGILKVAAGIHSVEARHASFLNLVNGDVPFPNGVDKAKSVSEVLDIASQFITSEISPPTSLGGKNEPMADRKASDDTSDVDVLNYALTLEHLENAFYRDGLKQYSDDQLMNADVLADYGSALTKKVPGHLKMVGDHEAAHVKAITNTVEKLGGDPVSEATYDFGYSTPSEFLGVAKALENTGVAAYAGAAGTVKADAVFKAAVGIHSVEARHASFLNELNVSAPFPKAVDKPKTMQEVKEIASQFIVEE